jgi:hypothetical protein
MNLELVVQIATVISLLLTAGAVVFGIPIAFITSDLFASSQALPCNEQTLPG